MHVLLRYLLQIYFPEEWYREPELVSGHYEEPEGEKRRKNGCTVACLLKAEGLVRFLHTECNFIYLEHTTVRNCKERFIQVNILSISLHFLLCVRW